jgi:hypothetical protein
MNDVTTITFKLTDEQVFKRFRSDLSLTIMPDNDNLSFRLCSDYGIITDGVDYKNVSTLQATINRALRWHQHKVKLVVQS